MQAFVPGLDGPLRRRPFLAARHRSALCAAVVLAVTIAIALAAGRFVDAAAALAIGAILAWQVARWYLRAKRLQSRLEQVELDLLGRQLQPHFLFNTLNAVSALMHQDVDAADEMLSALAELLWSALEADDAPEVPVRQELEQVQRYLQIMRWRFGDRLTATVEVDDGARDALVPTFVLQPLVENALRHGLSRRGGAGRVDVRVERRHACLSLRVADDGAGLPPDWDERREHGIGLRATRARLRQLYGASHRMELHNRPGGGVEAQVIVPYRTLDAWQQVS